MAAIRHLLLVLAVGLWSAEVGVAIRPEVLVGVPAATLGDVAVLTGDEAAVERLRGLRVAELPTLQPVVVDARLVVALATRAAAPATLRITGTGSVARRPRIVTVEEQVAAAASVAGGTATLVRASGDLTVPGSPTVAIHAEPLDPLAVGDVPFRVRVLDGDRELGRALVVLRVVREIDVVVALRTLERGALIGPQDLRIERRRAERANLPAAIDPAGITGRLVARRIAAGEAIVPALLATAPAVRAGSTVSVVWPGKGFAIEMQAVALADAKAGERLGLRRVGDRTVINGIARADGSVLAQP